jgi:hypothetical protein
MSTEDTIESGKLSRRGRVVAPMPCFIDVAKDKDLDLISSVVSLEAVHHLFRRGWKMVPARFVRWEYIQRTHSLKNF